MKRGVKEVNTVLGRELAKRQHYYWLVFVM